MSGTKEDIRTNRAFKNWADAWNNEADSIWPNETLIRIVKGDYIPGLKKDYKGKKVLDVGCGTGTNLLVFASLGMELYGTEVHEDIIKIAKNKLSHFGYDSTLKVGTNRQLPFETGYFNYLSSWNVLHYEPDEEKMVAAIAEYARVLKKNGRTFISTTGPKHLITEDIEVLGNHSYRIGKAGGFRKGEVYFYFDTPDYIKYYFSKDFQDVMVGRVHDFLFSKYQDYFIITGTKK